MNPGQGKITVAYPEASETDMQLYEATDVVSAHPHLHRADPRIALQPVLLSDYNHSISNWHLIK